MPSDVFLMVRIRDRPNGDPLKDQKVGQIIQILPGDWITDGGDFGNVGKTEHGWLRVAGVPDTIATVHTGTKNGNRSTCLLTGKDLTAPRRWSLPKGPLKTFRVGATWRANIDRMYDVTLETPLDDVPNISWVGLLSVIRDRRTGTGGITEQDLINHTPPALP